MIFDSENLAYRQAVHTAAQVFDSGEENLFERAFGICCGIATMLVPGVFETGQAPEPHVADLVCEQVANDIAEMT